MVSLGRVGTSLPQRISTQIKMTTRFGSMTSAISSCTSKVSDRRRFLFFLNYTSIHPLSSNGSVKAALYCTNVLKGGL